MLNETALKLIKQLNYIPDEMLAEYLEDKLLVRPDYPPGVRTEVKNRYVEYKANMKAAQKESNKVANPKRRK